MRVSGEPSLQGVAAFGVALMSAKRELGPESISAVNINKNFIGTYLRAVQTKDATDSELSWMMKTIIRFNDTIQHWRDKTSEIHCG